MKKKMVLGVLSLYMFGLMCALLVPKWLDMFFLYLVFKIQYKFVPGEYEYSENNETVKYGREFCGTSTQE
jgi:hypothetical protein